MWQNVTATEKYVWENVLLYHLPVLKENLEVFQVKKSERIENVLHHTYMKRKHF